MKFSIRYLLIFIVLLIVEILIGLFIKDTIIRPFFGDVLVILLLYALVRTFFANGIKGLPFYIFAFAALVECAQYFQWVKLLGLEDNKLMATILGMTFDIKDILCYFIGFLILVLVEYIQRKWIKVLRIN